MEVNKSKKRLAAIDLGTNTFHILIAEISEKAPFFVSILRQRDFIFLGKTGVEKINSDSYKKGLDKLEEYQRLMEQYGVADYKITGTEALRIASNGPQFIKEAFQRSGLRIDIIEGLREADLIYKGVQSYFPALLGDHIIMDIGGGSVEFIHFDESGFIWARSFPIGISVLYNRFQKSDPIAVEEQDAAKTFMKESLDELIQHIKKHHLVALIGSAGSFEILTSILEARNQSNVEGAFSKDQYREIFQEIMPLNKEERLAYPGIPPERVVLIPMAMILVEFVLELLEIEKVIVSPFSLKEGLISEML